MAAAVALNAAFIRMGFSQAAADVLTDPAQQNIDLDTLARFGDSECRALCQALRKPGGFIQLPAAAGQAAQQVANPGVAVSANAELNLKIACFMVRHYQTVGRTITAPDLTVANLNRFNVFRESQSTYQEPASVLKLRRNERMVRWFESFEEHLHLYNGVDGRPLSYVIRVTQVVPAAATDLAYGSPGSRYATFREELRHRTALDGEKYIIDNARVASLIRESLEDHENVIAWMQTHAAAQNGRGAWIALKGHYLGTSDLETIEVQAERRLETHTYRGEKPRYTFEEHVSIHHRAHRDIERTTGVPLTEQVKVRRLLASIQTPALATAISTIRAQPNLRHSFDESVNFIRGFISTTVENMPRNVSGVDTKASGNKGGNNKNKKKQKKGNKSKNTQPSSTGNKNNNSLDRYYKPAEWRKLSQEVRDKVLALRAKKRSVADMSTSETGSSTKDGSDDDDSNNNGITQRKVKAFRRNTSDTSDADSDTDDEE